MKHFKEQSFVWLLGIGVFASWIARWLLDDLSSVNANAWLEGYDGSTVAILICLACLLIYFFIAKQDETGQHNPDNLYYMGLLFTLASLVYSLVTLFIFNADDESQRVNNLIGSFGIALISTFVGILFRILLLQKVDGVDSLPPEPEVQGITAPQDLAETAFRLRQELTQTIADMNVFRKSIIQASNETVQEADKARAAMMQRVNDAADEQVRIFATLIKNVQKPLEELVTEQTERLQDVINLAEKNTTQLELSVQGSAIKITEGGEKIETAFNILLESLQDVVRHLQSSGESAHSLTAEFASVGTAIKQSSDTVTATTKALAKSLAEVTQVAPQYTQEFEQLIINLRQEAEQWQSMTQEVRSSLVQAITTLTQIVKQ